MAKPVCLAIVRNIRCDLAGGNDDPVGGHEQRFPVPAKPLHIDRSEPCWGFQGYPRAAAFTTCEDYALWGIWLRFFKPAGLADELYEYTVGSAGVSATRDDEQRAVSRMVMQRFRQLNLAETLPDSLQSLAHIL